VEPIAEERVRDKGTTAIGFRNRDLLQGDHLWRRYRVARPVPIRLAEVGGGFLPLCAIDGVGVRDRDSVFLEDLLNIAKSECQEVSRADERYKLEHGLPRRASCRAYAR
jgi:hypothetical protein